MTADNVGRCRPSMLARASPTLH